MKKELILTVLALSLAWSLGACDADPAECNHFDMDVNGYCDECGEGMISETKTDSVTTQPDYGAVTMQLSSEYVLGAYSSGKTVMKLYDSKIAVVESLVDTSSAEQGEQHIHQTGTWSFREDIYTVDFGSEQYLLKKNDEGLYSVQYFFVIKGQTGGSQEISVILSEDEYALAHR